MSSRRRETDSRQNVDTTFSPPQTQVTQRTHQSRGRREGNLFFKSDEGNKIYESRNVCRVNVCQGTSGRNAGKMRYFIPPSPEEQPRHKRAENERNNEPSGCEGGLDRLLFGRSTLILSELAQCSEYGLLYKNTE